MESGCVPSFCFGELADLIFDDRHDCVMNGFFATVHIGLYSIPTIDQLRHTGGAVLGVVFLVGDPSTEGSMTYANYRLARLYCFPVPPFVSSEIDVSITSICDCVRGTHTEFLFIKLMINN